MIEYLQVKTLPQELADWRDKIEAIATDEGLNFFKTIFEVVSYDKMNEIAAYDGFPTRYPHWRFGMAYEQLAKSYAYGLSKIYELVINTDPCYAYLLEGNELVDQKLVMAHVYGHCDFFKNNFWFSRTDRKMLDTLANNASRIRRYMDLYGYSTVERFIDVCLSIDNLIDFHRPYRPSDRQQALKPQSDLPDELIGAGLELPKLQAKEYMDEYVNTDAYLNEQREKIEREKEEQKRHPSSPERDVLYFLMENANLTRWQRNVLEIIREEAYYFAPQRMTKIMNEGWACFWHTHIMTQRGVLDQSELIDYADRHSGTVAPHQGRVNPYRLGLELFKDIFKRWNKGQFGRDYYECDDLAERESWNTNAMQGKQKIFEVRRHHNDLTFLDEFLTPEFCAQQSMFTFENNPRARQWQIASTEFQDVKAKMLGQLTNMGQPIIDVYDANYKGGELLLIHRFEGVELDDKYTNPTLKNLYAIWKRPVHLVTHRKDKNNESTQSVLVSYNGSTHSEESFQLLT